MYSVLTPFSHNNKTMPKQPTVISQEISDSIYSTGGSSGNSNARLYNPLDTNIPYQWMITGSQLNASVFLVSIMIHYFA